MKKIKFIGMSVFLVAIATTFITSKVFAEKSSIATSQPVSQSQSQSDATNNLANGLEDVQFLMADTTCSTTRDPRDPYYEALQAIASKWTSGTNTATPDKSKIFDINGDGLIDIIQAYITASSDGSTSEYYNIFLNQAGAGYENTYSCSRSSAGQYCGDCANYTN